MKLAAGKKYFVQEHLHRTNVAHGGIGNIDIERILLNEGFEAIRFPYHKEFSIKAKAARAFFLVKLLTQFPANAVIVFQHPLYAQLHKILIDLLAVFRPSVRIICFITDINGLKDADNRLLKKETRFFKKLRYFIVHNAAMDQWLHSFHPSAKTASINFFDFPATSDLKEKTKKVDVAFAGFLDKSSFVSQLAQIPEVNFHLYGPGETKTSTAGNVHYHGVFNPEQLPGILKGSFGLVWDGDSIDGLKGVFGEYNRLISPHKLSLYMIAGLPVIAHDKSAVAPIIHEFKIGFTVATLREIKHKTSMLSEEEYQLTRTNCRKLATKISKGECLKDALKNLEPYLR